MFDEISIPEMPENENDAAAWVAWFGACMQALIQLIMSLFDKLKGSMGGGEDETNAAG